MEERNYRKSMDTLKKVVFLVLILLLSIILQFLTIVIMQGLILGISIILIWFFVVYPSVSFAYSKKFISNGKYRLLQSILCPMAFTFSYTCLLFTEEETYLYALVIFVWCELWSLLGLITNNKNKLAQNISVNEDITNN